MNANVELLQKLVAAKIAYWDALGALERAVAPDGEFSDSANDAVIDYIDILASCMDGSDVSDEHLQAVAKMVAA